MKKHLLTALVIIAVCPLWAVDANIQVFYDFGSLWNSNKCQNHRSERVTTTVEFFHPDNWGSTYFFVDFDYSVNKNDPEHTPFGAYWEISRSFNFWKQSKVKDLSIHLEYDGGLGTFGYRQTPEEDQQIGGFGVNHAVLVGPEYFLHTADYKNTFTLQLLFRYAATKPNMWHYKEGGQWVHQSGNQVPLQFTFVWACKDFCTAKGLTFCGFFDIYGDRANVNKWEKVDGQWQAHTVGPKQYCVFLSEPQLWYSIGQWFKCPNLCIGTEIEVSYNFTGEGWMVNPCLGLRWNFL